MSNLVRTKAKDNSTVEFIYQAPMQGGLKDVYFAPDKSYVVAFYREPIDQSGKDRIERIVGQYRKGIFNQNGGEYWKKCFCWPEKIVEYNGMLGVTVPCYDKRFFFDNGTEKQGKWFASAKLYNKRLKPDQKGDLFGYLRMCLQLSRGVRRLHAAGLAHSDLSYKNCLVDPVSGSACIIDIDGLVVPNLFPPDVCGTHEFIAPEVVATMNLPKNDSRKKIPRRETDQHALAVLIYLYLLHRHPLCGGKVWSQEDEIQDRLEMGEKAIFVENPLDTSNRPKLNETDNCCLPWADITKIPYATTGPHLQKLFNQAFIEGLHNPTKRPTADDWENALVKTSDMILPCSNSSCQQKYFIFDNTTRPICPYCGTPYKGVLPILNLYSLGRDKITYKSDNQRIMVFSGQSLFHWHVNRYIFPNEKLSPDKMGRVGYFSFYKGKWFFVNEKLDSMKDIKTQQVIPRGSKVELTEGLQLVLSPEPGGRLIQVQIVHGA